VSQLLGVVTTLCSVFVLSFQAVNLYTLVVGLELIPLIMHFSCNEYKYCQLLSLHNFSNICSIGEVAMDCLKQALNKSAAKICHTNLNYVFRKQVIKVT